MIEKNTCRLSRLGYWGFVLTLKIWDYGLGIYVESAFKLMDF